MFSQISVVVINLVSTLTGISLEDLLLCHGEMMKLLKWGNSNGQKLLTVAQWDSRADTRIRAKMLLSRSAWSSERTVLTQK